MNYKELWSIFFERRFSVPKERPIQRTLRSFTLAEKSFFYFFVAIFIISGLSLLWKVSNAYLVEIPSNGGTLTEGVIGNPRFINPVLALSEADKNLTSLVYSGLIRVTPEGEVVNDLAENLDISPNRLVYTVTLRDDAKFHDGEPVTADDVIFTIQKIIDPIIKSPKRGNWDGVSISKIDDSTISFTLKKVYTPFIYNLTTGIIPRHIWKNVTDDEFSFSQFNTLPVGSGPYKIDVVERNSGGIPNYYKLTPFNNSVGKVPYISNLVFKFYSNEESLINAYNNGSIDSLSGLSPEKLLDLNIKNAHIIQSPLPRVFAVFFNQTQSKVLLNKEVRQALNLASPRVEIVENVLGGYGVSIDGPLPGGLYPWTIKDSSSTLEENIQSAKELLEKSGWKANSETGILEKKSGSGTIEMSFSISTGDAPELKAVAEELKSAWEKLGAKVEVMVFETGDLNQNVIRARNFEALLFGVVIGRDADIYPFWHSSQRNDPGLNIALYANTRADTLLDKVRVSKDREELEENLKDLTEEIKDDAPAVFLYTPSFLYVLPDKVKAEKLGLLTVAQDRFLGIRDWYIETDKVWEIFRD